ncbi:MAG: hypothetical protein DRO11_08500 [Methanobacteriota archaeon]|nr:MAG: hypothetical protein DRO11_08500 [Euryarchaeota archaeon]
MDDVTLEEKILKKITIVPVETISEVLEHAMVWKDKDRSFLTKIKRLVQSLPETLPVRPDAHPSG